MSEMLTESDRELLEDLADLYGATHDHEPVILDLHFSPAQLEKIAAALKKALLPSELN